jgi:uncharacterized membrane protein
MDRLISYPFQTGQPLRPEDWGLIQDQQKLALAAIICGLSGVSSCILSGMVMTNDGTTINITEGYVFIVDEIFYVPAVSFHIGGSNELYLISNFTTTENRTFFDTTTHYVWAYRRYQIVYQNTDPGSSIKFVTLSTLISLIMQNNQSNLTGIQSMVYAAGFTGATAYNAVSLQGNSLNGYMLEAAFTASVTAGKLCTLPIGCRPSADLVGFFFNQSTAPGVLKIKKDGDVYVSGASLSGTNYITFQFFMRFQDLVNYALPITGGGQIQDGDKTI